MQACFRDQQIPRGDQVLTGLHTPAIHTRDGFTQNEVTRAQPTDASSNAAAVNASHG
jgi:hypothetical protein